MAAEPVQAISLWQKLVDRSQSSLDKYQAPPPLKYVSQSPDERLFIIACADGRVDPAQIFSIQPGEASVIKVAGGTVTEDVIRYLEIFSSIVNIGMIVVLKHTDCGGLNRTDAEVAAINGARNPEHAHELQGKKYYTFKDVGLEKSVRNDTAKLKAWNFLPKHTKVAGWAYETETGKLREIVPADEAGSEKV